MCIGLLHALLSKARWWAANIMFEIAFETGFKGLHWPWVAWHCSLRLRSQDMRLIRIQTHQRFIYTTQRHPASALLYVICVTLGGLVGGVGCDEMWGQTVSLAMNVIAAFPPTDNTVGGSNPRSHCFVFLLHMYCVPHSAYIWLSFW